MAALKSSRPDIAAAFERKLQSLYAKGIWADHAGDQSSYYLQNWAWFGTALYQKKLDPFRPFRAR